MFKLLAIATFSHVILYATAFIEVNNLHLISEVQARFAITDVLSTIKNTDPWAAQRATFEAFLPDRAFITGFSLEWNNRKQYGTIKEKEKARLEFENAVARGETAVHITQTNNIAPPNTKVFQIVVNIEKNAEVHFNLTYQEMLTRSEGVYKQILNVKSHTPPKDIQLDVLIVEKGNFRNLGNGRGLVHVPKPAANLGYLPNKDLLNIPASQVFKVRDTKQQGGSLVYTWYEYDNPQPWEPKLNEGQIVLLFDVDLSSSMAGDLITYDGYFLHTFAPDQLPTGSKTIVFAIDKSGSMRGKKFEQVQDAFAEMLSQLRRQDRVNIVMFSKDVTVWKDRPVEATQDNIRAAIDYVKAQNARGGTNIHDAMIRSLEQSQKGTDNSLDRCVFFMTDGKPTVGEKIREQIMRKVRQANRNDVSIHTISFGDKADYPLMQQVSRDNGDGVARRIFLESSAAVQLKGHMRQVANPKLANVNIVYLNGGRTVASLVKPDQGGMFFDGMQMTTVGKMSAPMSDMQVKIEGTQVDSNNVQRPLQQTMTKKVGALDGCFPGPKADWGSKGSNYKKPSHFAVCPDNEPSTTSDNDNDNQREVDCPDCSVMSFFDKIICERNLPAACASASPSSGGNFWDRIQEGFRGFRRSGGRRKRANDYGEYEYEEEEENGSNGGNGGTSTRETHPSNSVGGFIERTFAYLTIHEKTKEFEDWATPQTEKDKARKEAVDLCMKYGFVSKFTSMVLTSQDKKQQNELQDLPQGASGKKDVTNDDVPQGSALEKKQINTPSTDGKCRVGLVIVLDESVADQTAMRTDAKNLVSAMRRWIDRSEFTIAIFTRRRQLKIINSVADGYTEDVIHNNIDRSSCADCPEMQDLLDDYLYGRPGVQKRFVVLTGGNDWSSRMLRPPSHLFLLSRLAHQESRALPFYVLSVTNDPIPPAKANAIKAAITKDFKIMPNGYDRKALTEEFLC